LPQTLCGISFELVGGNDSLVERDVHRAAEVLHLRARVF
jgi:hypothetical protein